MPNGTEKSINGEERKCYLEAFESSDLDVSTLVGTEGKEKKTSLCVLKFTVRESSVFGEHFFLCFYLREIRIA